MTSTFNYKTYLENRVANGVTIVKTEKWLQEDMDNFAKGKITRSDVQALKRSLVKMNGAKQLLGNKGHKDFLCKIRNCESTDYVTNLHAKNGRSQEIIGMDNQNENESEEKEDNVGCVKRRRLGDLSRSGKVYRRKKLLHTLEEDDIQLLKSIGEKPNAFQTLNYQKDAHMSERDMMKTQKLVKEKVGANVLAGRRLKKKASDQTMPDGIKVDDFKAVISLQSGLNKAAERLIMSGIIPEEQRKTLMTEKMCTFYTKSGQDGTTGMKDFFLPGGWEPDWIFC